MPLLNRKGMCAVMLALGLGASTAGAEVVIVVSAKSAVTTLNQNQVADIFLGKTRRFPGGEMAVPVDQAEGSPVRDEFYMKLVGKSPAQVKAFWSKNIFTGKGQPPMEVPGSNTIRKAVAANPNYIGYIDRGAVDATVKTLILLD